MLNCERAVVAKSLKCIQVFNTVFNYETAVAGFIESCSKAECPSVIQALINQAI